jgi:hypothetical protein
MGKLVVMKLELWERATTLWRKALARRRETRSEDSSTWPVAEGVVYSCDAGVRERIVGVQLW